MAESLRAVLRMQNPQARDEEIHRMFIERLRFSRARETLHELKTETPPA